MTAQLGTGLGADMWDPEVIIPYVQKLEELGYAHLTMGDHVLGADPSRYQFIGPFTYKETSHEPYVCLAFIAAVTKQLILATSFIVMPPRQTVLAAKQAAELFILSCGRFRLGVGLGAGEGEYEWAGHDFHSRGVRLAAQVRLMRRLWSEELVTDYEDRWEKITAGGINPRPDRQIPIWFGGMDERQLKRMARLGDGWIPHFERKDGELYEAVTLAEVVDRTGRYVPGAPAAEVIERVQGYLSEYGRDPLALPIQASCPLTGDIEEDLYWAGKWEELGSEAITVNLARRSVEERLDYLARFKEAWDKKHA